MTRHRVVLATFFVQFHCPSGAVRLKVLDLHLEGPALSRAKL
jgi:hypothetical protein